ncbi:MAG: HAD family hydrolase [Tepidiformaceae bacterium]
MAFRTLLLDIDGTLLDTREFIYSAFEHTIRANGLTPTGRTELQRVMGLPLEEIYGSMGATDPWAMVAAHRAFQGENLHLSFAFPGVIGVLERLRAAGIAMAAVTSRSRGTSLRTLEDAGLDGFFAAVVSAEDTIELKPDPAPLRLALALLKAPVETAAMVGDTAHDIVAGRAAGMKTIGVTYGFNPQAVIDARPDWTIASIAELPAVLRLA